MINQWMSPKDIAALDGMPTSIQGVHKKAKRDGWPSRKKEGVQGPGVEFLVPLASAPNEEVTLVGSERGITGEHNEGLGDIWMALISRLSERDRNSLLNHAIMNGITSLLPNTHSQRSLAIAQLIESLPEGDQREILHLIEAKKLGALLDSTQGRKKA